MPVAIKDNIDVAGMPTTAACPAFAYTPTHDATAVARLRAAGAIVIGKTNLDQFATGLNGTRSPYGTPRNAFNPDLIPGGSSSGSAVAVAAGIVPLALGTDTAGSGRVPAGFNNIVGLKAEPRPGLDPWRGAGLPHARLRLGVRAHRRRRLERARGHGRPRSRRPLFAQPAAGHARRHPGPISRSACRCPGSGCFSAIANSSAATTRRSSGWRGSAATIVETDIEPFYETARLLYDGPWVAERTITVTLAAGVDPDAIHPVTREIILSGLRPTAIDAFTAFYKLERLRRVADYTFQQIDALALPTAPTIYTVKQVLADPIQLNSRLGTYTNFVNLLDLCGLALPAAFTDQGVPFGITLLAPGGQDAKLAGIGAAFHADTKLPLGALKEPQPV